MKKAKADNDERPPPRKRVDELRCSHIKNLKVMLVAKEITELVYLKKLAELCDFTKPKHKNISDDESDSDDSSDDETE